jgi:hypothetical protein
MNFYFIYFSFLLISNIFVGTIVYFYTKNKQINLNKNLEIMQD